jgi:hypothetical protein
VSPEATPRGSVFLSYRRASGAFVARAIYQYLVSEGYDVFLDVEKVDSGRFESVILNQLGSREHFLVILTPETLTGLSSRSDWVRRELERALELGKNVVPILVEGVAPGDLHQEGYDPVLQQLETLNALQLDPNFFDAAMRMLTDRFLKQPTLQELSIRTAEEHYEASVRAREAEDWETAERELTAAIERNPRRPDYFNNRAIARAAMDDLPGALDDSNQALALDPSSQQLAIIRSNILQAMGDLQGALDAYRQWAQRTGNWEQDLPSP